MSLPPITFHAEADEDGWTSVMERLAGSWFRVYADDLVGIYEGEVADAAVDSLIFHIDGDDRRQVTIPIRNIVKVEYL